MYTSISYLSKSQFYLETNSSAYQTIYCLV